MALYLITGIGGFIGSSLARELLSRGEGVRGLDNFSTGKRENLDEILARIDLQEADRLSGSGWSTTKRRGELHERNHIQD